MKILAAFIAVFLGSISQAQVTSSHDSNSSSTSDTSAASKLWITGGPGFSNLSNVGNSGIEKRTAVSIGAELELSMNPLFSFQTGLDYVQKGISATLFGQTGTLSLNYLEVPVLAKLKFPFGNEQFSFSAGPYAAYAVAGSANDTFRKPDFGARFGAAFEIPLQERLAFSIGANYDLGLVNITPNDATISNRTFMASVGLGLRL